MGLADIEGILTDLAAESRDLDDLVAHADWATPTPAPGWTIAHQIAHLAWTDAKALIAVRTPDEFGAEVKRLLAADGERYVDDGAAEGAAKPRAQLLEEWRSGRVELAAALAAVPPGEKFPWYGPPMSASTMATARLMETWAHGQDVFDALGAEHPTGRIRHVAWLGIRTRDFAFSLNGITPPAEPFRVELVAPDGQLWTWGPEDAAQRVTGSALDFCLLVTQRRNLADTDVVATGIDAQEWLGIAQAFAGPPGPGREAGALFKSREGRP